MKLKMKIVHTMRKQSIALKVICHVLYKSTISGMEVWTVVYYNNDNEVERMYVYHTNVNSVSTIRILFVFA